ncbi:hypothetical protein NVP1205O_25 [Vibrio phage 1.205.O._10N.222.51.A7]|nr:hypothetical protein NVP1205O_25 [Vibrio phage 1.205.O._10N.222.51.A7]
MKNRFYLACLRDNVGSNVSFHCKNGRGYSTNVSQAHVYTLEEAQKAWDDGRSFELPLSADHVDEMLMIHVDHQYIPYETQLSIDDSEMYVGIVKGKYDGNDRYFLTRSASSNDYTKAVEFTKDDVVSDRDSEVYFLPKSLVDNNTRKTFQSSNINKRKMTQGAGLKQPKRVTRELQRNKRNTTGKTRTNCIVCGQLVWDFIHPDMEVTCGKSKCEQEGYSRRTFRY